MINIIRKQDCTGCHACYNICPKQCIVMKVDKEGFWYPSIDKDKCIDCNMCKKVCSIYNNPDKVISKISAYACINTNEQVRKSSSSGGIFALLCENVIKSGGIVFGAAFNNNFEVEHMYADTLEGCSKFKGSKYVQSKIGNTYRQAMNFLNDGRIVLFTGTQCQIKGLNLFLNKKYNNLITSEIICHGVPSPKVFKYYKNSLEKKYNSNIKDIRFRDKIQGWNKFSYVTEFENDRVYCNTLDKDLYMKGFLSNLYLRPSCYECKAKNFTSNSDISLGDYWGVEKIHSEFVDDKGVSLVLANTKKGERIIDKILPSMNIINTNLEYAIDNNPCIIKPVNYNVKREKFFNALNENNIEKIINKYTKISTVNKLKVKVRKILKRR